MRQRIICLLVRHSSFTKFIFIFYYSHIIKDAISALERRNKLKNTINNFGDNYALLAKDGSSFLDASARFEAARYVQVSKRTLLHLEDKFTSIPDYNLPLKIMPLGDSITYGVIGKNDKGSGGYRTELWNKFVADGFKVEFVGSLSSGSDSLNNKNHEGHPGWKIRQIAASVHKWLDISQPDIILLMIGTNDTKRKSLRTMIEDLSDLIDQITAYSPGTHLLVASIPPIHPTAEPPIRSLRAMYFNAAIPSIVNSKVAQGKKVHFVDMRSLTVNDLTSSLPLDLDNGLHPNAQGYRKIANFWHDAVLRVTNKQQISPIGACYQLPIAKL